MLTEREVEDSDTLTKEIRGMDLRKGLMALHPTIRRALGDIRLNGVDIGTSVDEEAFDKLKGVLCRNGTLQAWSDGSYTEDKMGHGYMIRTGDFSDMIMITGRGASINGSVRSSLRAEHCGALSVQILVLLMEKTADLRIGGTIELYIDNMTVVH